MELERVNFSEFMSRAWIGLLGCVGAFALTCIVQACTNMHVDYHDELQTYAITAATMDALNRQAPNAEVEQILKDEEIRPQVGWYIRCITALAINLPLEERVESVGILFQIPKTEVVFDQVQKLSSGVLYAVQSSTMEPFDRVMLFQQTFPIDSFAYLSKSAKHQVDATVTAWMKGARSPGSLGLEAKPIQPPDVRWQSYWKLWLYFAAAVQLIAGLGFCFCNPERDAFWFVPTNLLSWIVLIGLFPIAYVVPIICIGFFSVCVYIVTALKAIFIDYDLRQIGERISERVKQIRQNRMRHEMDQRIRMTELATVGGDVLDARARLERFAARIPQLPAAEQAAALSKLDELKQALEHVSEQRRAQSLTRTDDADHVLELDDLSKRIEGLVEAERVLSSSAP